MSVTRREIERLKSKILSLHPEMSSGELFTQVRESMVNKRRLPKRPVDPSGEYPGMEPDSSDPKVQQLTNSLRKKFYRKRVK